MRTLTTTDLELLAVASPLDRDTVDDYTAGDCWLLAAALQRLGAGQLIAVSEADDPTMWCHMGIRLEDGDILDANGIQDEQSFLKRWGSSIAGPQLQAVELDSKRWHELTWEQEPLTSEDAAREVAEELLSWQQDL